MSTLLIVESPGKIKKIESILGSGYKVIASYGHIIDLNKETEEGYYHEFKVWEFRFKGTTKEPM